MSTEIARTVLKLKTLQLVEFHEALKYVKDILFFVYLYGEEFGCSLLR